MNCHLSLTSLRTKLLQRGLPRDYVERAIAEWSDHQEDTLANSAQSVGDVSNDHIAATFELGSESVLLTRTIAEYRRRFFVGRHPVWTFLVAPWPSLLVAWIAYLLLVGIAGSLFVTDEDLSRRIWLLFAADAVLVFGVPVLVAAAFCRLAARSCTGLRWVLASTAMIGLAAFSLKTHIQAPTGGPGTGSYAIGFGIVPADFLHPADWVQPLQAIVPGLVLVGFAVRQLILQHQAIHA
jgi:hypothetical protein